MTPLFAEALVLAAITAAPFALALAVAWVIVTAIGAERLAAWLRLPWDEDGR